jgi:hypothetical protein
MSRVVMFSSPVAADVSAARVVVAEGAAADDEREDDHL